MTYRRPSIPRRPSLKSLRVNAAFMSGGVPEEADTKPSNRSGKRGPQKESLVGKANREWAATRGGVLRRNRRGFADLPGGGKMPLGLSEPLIQDEIGYITITVTPALVGRRIAVLLAIEDKTATGVVEPHQLACIEELKAAGAIAGISRSVEDSEAILEEWMNG